MTFHRYRTAVSAVAVLAGAALVLGACGDDDDDDDAGGGGTSAALAPTGAPIEIGFVNTENSPAGSYSDGRFGVEAAVEYVNRDLGGVNGRPLEVENCITNASPESSLGCANGFVQGNKVAVMPHIDIGAPAAMQTYSQAGMPYVGGVEISADEYTMPTSFSFVGAAPGAIAGMSAFAGQQGAKKVTILGPDIPQTSPAIDGFMRPVLAATGVTDVSVVLEAPTAADFTPVLTRVANDNPDMVLNLLGGPSCVKSMQAARTVNLAQDKIIYSQECASDQTIEEGGGEGAAYQSSFLSPDSDEPNVAIFRDKMKQYKPDAPIGTAVESGFNSVMNLYAVLKKISGDITRESITAALKATNNEPGFLSHPFTCNGQQFPGLASICDTNVRILRYENGEFVDITNQWIDGTATLTGG